MSTRSFVHAQSAVRRAALVIAVTLGSAWMRGGAALAQQPPPFAPPVLAPPPSSPAEAAPAAAPPPVGSFAAPTGKFGSPRQVVVNADLKFSIIRKSSSASGVSSSTSVVIQPALDYFIAPNLSVGGLLSYAHGLDATVGDNTFGFQVRAGYNLEISDAFSFWPRLAIGYFHGSGPSINGIGGDLSGYAIPLQIFAPLLLHVTQHLFIGFGPTLTTDLVHHFGGEDAGKLTFVGVQLVLGGYFGTD